MAICPKCGLPEEACVCREITKTEQRARIETVKRKYGKVATVISGISVMNLKELAKKLKQQLACGGTIKNNTIELQGNHAEKVKKILEELGFTTEKIE